MFIGEVDTEETERLSKEAAKLKRKEEQLAREEEQNKRMKAKSEEDKNLYKKVKWDHSDFEDEDIEDKENRDSGWKKVGIRLNLLHLGRQERECQKMRKYMLVSFWQPVRDLKSLKLLPQHFSIFTMNTVERMVNWLKVRSILRKRNFA